MTLRKLFAALAAVALLQMSADVPAQAYPVKSIRLIAPYPPGGGVDAVARVVAAFLSTNLGQQIVVDNRPGASGRIGTELVAKAAPDGYTLLLGSVGPNAIIPATYPRLSYGAKDFAPISLVATADYILVVHPSLPVKSTKDLISLAKAHPGVINFGSTGHMGGPHLAGELFKLLAKVDMVHIAYKGGAPSVIAILTGETATAFGSPPTVMPYVKTGKLRAIASTGPKRSTASPSLPALSETLPGLEVTQWWGLLAPAGTADPVAQRLQSEIAKVASDAAFRKQLENLGADVTTNSSNEFADHIVREIEKWTRVVTAAGLLEK